jgi:hypothetical protein
MKWLSLIIEVAAAIIAGLLTSLWISGQFAFLVGLMTLILLEMFNLRYNMASVNTTTGGIASVIKGMISDGAFSEIRLLYGLRTTSHADKHLVSVPRDKVLRFWHDCIGRAEAHWFVTTYTLADETWGLGWGQEISFAIQNERLASQCKITRVFVVDSNDERDALLEIMQRQSKIGVDVKWILKKDLIENNMVREALKELETIEVAVIDGKWIYRTYIDRKRRMKGASASDDPELLKKAIFLVNEAYRGANPFRKGTENAGWGT